MMITEKNLMAEAVDDILKRLANESKETSGSQSVNVKATETREISELAHLLLNQFVDSKAPPVHILTPEKVGTIMPLRTTLQADNDLKSLVDLQQQRCNALHELNANTVALLEKVITGVRKEEKRISRWHTQKNHALETQRAAWYKRADVLAEERGNQMSANHANIEMEWQNLAQTFPRGSAARNIMEATIPSFENRQELSGGDVQSSVMRRAKQTDQFTSNVENVHWKLRNTVDSLIDAQKEKHRKAAQQALLSVSKGMIHDARASVLAWKAAHSAKDVHARHRTEVLESSLRNKQIPYDHVMRHFAQIVQNNKQSLIPRLSKLE